MNGAPVPAAITFTANQSQHFQWNQGYKIDHHLRSYRPPRRLNRRPSTGEYDLAFPLQRRDVRDKHLHRRQSCRQRTEGEPQANEPPAG